MRSHLKRHDWLGAIFFDRLCLGKRRPLGISTHALYASLFGYPWPHFKRFVVCHSLAGTVLEQRQKGELKVGY
jgi:hypothetical protein